MINKLTALTLKLVKTNLSVILVFYMSGFLSFLAYYRVLGLPYIVGSSQVYAELAGKNILLILQTFIFLITQPNYFIDNIKALNWVGFSLYLWLVVVVLLAIIYTILKLFPAKPIIIAIRQSPYTYRIRLALIAISVLATFNIETQSFYVENILQTANLSQFHKEKKNLLKFEKVTKVDYQRRVEKLQKFNYDHAIEAFLFSINKSYDKSGGDEKRLNAFMLMILIVSLTAIILVIYRQSTFIKWVLFVFAFAQAILIPFNYGILGVKYQYPVVSLDYAEKNKVLHKEAVFLLAKSDGNLVIYDRLNFFHISYIAQSSVIQFNQVFTGSPFSNCRNGGFKPCESYALDK